MSRLDAIHAVALLLGKYVCHCQPPTDFFSVLYPDQEYTCEWCGCALRMEEFSWRGGEAAYHPKRTGVDGMYADCWWLLEEGG